MLEKRIIFRCDQTLYNKLTKVAEIDKISVGKLCRNLINGGLKNEKKNNKHKKTDRQEDI